MALVRKVSVTLCIPSDSQKGYARYHANPDHQGYYVDPTPEEIALYSPFLDRQVKIIQPSVIATLGRPELHRIRLGDDVAPRVEDVGDQDRRGPVEHHAQAALADDARANEDLIALVRGGRVRVAAGRTCPDCRGRRLSGDRWRGGAVRILVVGQIGQEFHGVRQYRRTDP